ncbi:PAS domain S-box protein [Nostoc sp. MG11]|uniref:hybrid sensor histidine kinase/response regulator n=1 Tax=Nostoc sp. MG11 TaxID=2721166 RepID=UPI00186647DB|nr:PAS domain S-box protein [Nostoc sp. MG11]
MNNDESNQMCLLKDCQQAELALQQQIERQRLVMAIAVRIRQSLNLSEVLNTTVSEVRQLLRADRVFMYRFEPDYSGTVVVECVGEGWLSILNAQAQDTYFMETKGEEYIQGRIQAVADIYTAGLSECHRNLLAQFQVRANLVVPILQGEKLWGLLVGNQCAAPRWWQEWEIDLLEQLATQVSIAIQQSQLYEQVQSELAERKRAEEALEQSEEKFRLFAENIYAAIWIAIPDFSQILYISPGYAKIWGRSCQSLLDQNYWINTIHPEDCNLMSKTLQQQPSEQPVEVEYRILRPDGSVRWIWDRCFAVYDQHKIVRYCGGIAQDITERKQAEQKIKEQAALLDIASDAILVQDFHGEIRFWSQGAERLYGWQASEALGKNSKQLLYKETSTQLEAAFQDALECGSWQGELHKLTKSGKEIIVESRWTLMQDEAFQPKSILSVDTDITEKKQLQAQFLHTQRLESLGTLASGIAHDLNNILTPIMASVEMLALKLPHVDTRNKQLLKVLEDNSKRAADLVKQILTFARGSETKIQGRGVCLQIEPLLLEVEQITKSTFPKSIKINKNLPKDKLLTILADATQIHQVLMNLCINARDAMPKGGDLSISAENSFVDENFARMNLNAQVGSYVVITVSDTGFGIPPLILERIFEPFFTTKELGKGTGLGLSTVIGIVKNYGGFVNVESKVGKGTKFQVYLPSMEESTRPLAENLESLLGNGELILIVDDEAAIVEITKVSLEDHNYKTLTASNGIEAISLYAEHQKNISMVLMDMMMPSMDGLAVISILQQMNPSVKVLAVSGIPTNDQFLEAADAGVKAFLRKPYTIYELLHAINDLLSKL